MLNATGRDFIRTVNNQIPTLAAISVPSVPRP